MSLLDSIASLGMRQKMTLKNTLFARVKNSTKMPFYRYLIENGSTSFVTSNSNSVQKKEH